MRRADCRCPLLCPLPSKPGAWVEVLGSAQGQTNDVVLRNAFFRQVEPAGAAEAPLPLLTTARAVKRLKRKEALRGYPVKIRGVITWGGGSGAVIQDSTMGVYVDNFRAEGGQTQRVGDYWEVEGQTTAEFSPNVWATKVTRLGEGSLPPPVLPAWDQLINGSLDTQYVELKGVVTGIDQEGISLLTHGNILHVAMPEKRAEELRCYENALIRLRGCLWAVKDENTHMFKIGKIADARCIH